MKEVTLHHSELVAAIKQYIAAKENFHGDLDDIEVRLLTGAGLQQFIIAEIKE